jgi:hypothetical protein
MLVSLRKSNKRSTVRNDTAGLGEVEAEGVVNSNSVLESPLKYALLNMPQVNGNGSNLDSRERRG